MEKLRQPATTMLSLAFTSSTKPPASTMAAIPPVTPYCRNLHTRPRIMGLLLHEWIEKRVMKSFECLKALDRSRRPDQYSDSGPLARNTVAICSVADEESLAGRSIGSGHERLEAFGMRFKQPDVAGCDDVVGCESHRGEFLGCGVVRKDADLLAGTLQSGKQLRYSQTEAATQVTERPTLNPFGHDRVHAFRRPQCGSGRLGDQNAVEVDDLLGSQALPYAAVSTDDANSIRVALRNGMKHHVARHLQAQWALPVECAIDVKRHETDVPPIVRC